MRVKNDLKPHNKETYGKLKKILQTDNKTCIIQPTGSGKTFLILNLIEDYAEQGRDIIVIEPQKYIFEQLQKKIEKYELSSSNVRFLTYSALGKLNDEKIQEYHLPKLVIVDEMHRAGAPIWGSGLQKMFDTFSTDCKYIGFSATPIRFLDGKRNMAEELFGGCIANEIGLADAILNRILPLPRYIAGLYTYENEVNVITNKIQKSHNSDEEKKELLEEVAIMKKNLDKSKGISSIFKKYLNNNKGKFIAFCRNVKHLQQMRPCLEEWFSEAGIKANLYEIHCKNPMNDKQFKDFMNDDKFAVCLSIGMLAEGVHGIDGVILLRDTISPNLYYQQIGRAFSVDMNTVPIIFDLVANCESIMDCNLKNDLLSAIDKKDRDKVNKETCVNDGQDNERVDDPNDCDKKEITREDIESFFVFDQVIDAVNVFKEIEGRIVGNDWSEEDEDLMRQYYPSMGSKVKSMLSQERSVNAINRKALNLGLSKNKWTEEKIEILKENYVVYGATGMKKYYFPEMGRDKISRMAHKLGLVFTGNILWSEEKIAILKKYYPLEGKRVVDRLPNITERQCINKASSLKVKYIGDKASKYRFVYFNKTTNKWQVIIEQNRCAMACQGCGIAIFRFL